MNHKYFLLHQVVVVHGDEEPQTQGEEGGTRGVCCCLGYTSRGAVIHHDQVSRDNDVQHDRLVIT